MSDRYDLVLQLPEFYRSVPFEELQRVLGEMVRQAAADVDLTLAQLWPQTASGWGLTLWETAYGIPVDVARDTEFRRSRIISKLRGQGVPTAELIRAVAASFVNGAVDVVEHSGQYYFTVKFTSIMGVPPNIEDLTAAINEIKPAHLAYLYEYLYRTWLQGGAYTWGELSGRTWEELRSGTLPE